MQAGYINVLLLLTAEVSYQQAVLAVVQARAARLADVVALYQAVGGGWWNREDVPPPKPLIVATSRPVAAVTPSNPMPAKADPINRFDVVQVDARTQSQLYETDRRAESAVPSAAVEASSDNPIDHISAVFHDFSDERER
jgi:hypothetical protein